MTSKWPSPTEAWSRLHAAGPPEWVMGHTACVHDLALEFGQRATQRGHSIDLDLLRAGAILHDIGRSITQDPRHAHLGAQMLRDEVAPQAVVRIVERHTGAGLLADDATSLDLPPGDYVPATWEEKLVAHADNLHSGAKRLTLGEVRQKYAAKGLHAAGERISALHQEIGALIGTDPDAVTSEPGNGA